MSKTVIYETSAAFDRIPLPPAPASTFHSDHITLDASAAVAEADSIARDAFDELEWHNIVSTPHVRHGLRRLAAEARREYNAGETEEGGFALD
jgi:hypothetical protein